MVMLLVAFAMAPFADTYRHTSGIFLLMTLAVLISAVNAVSDLSRGFWVRLAIGLVICGLVIGHAVASLPILHVAGQMFSVLFFVLVSISILRHVILSRRVEVNTVFAAICVYLLMATTWATLYSILEAMRPQSFLINGQPFSSVVSINGMVHVDFLYFSIVTLTTVGYGDILPQSGAARILAGLEALIGQIYVAVLIAWLVGRYLAGATINGGGGPQQNQKERHDT
jgi:voltage-gated potassium channel Kch